MPDEAPAPLEHWDPNDPDVLHLKLPNKVQLSTIGDVLDKLEPALRSEGEPIPKLLLDMTSTAFCSPTGITIVAAGIEKLFQAKQVQAGRIVEPRGRLLRRYLARMNFYRELGAPIRKRSPAENRGTSDRSHMSRVRPRVLRSPVIWWPQSRPTMHSTSRLQPRSRRA